MWYALMYGMCLCIASDIENAFTKDVLSPALKKDPFGQ